MARQIRFFADRFLGGEYRFTGESPKTHDEAVGAPGLVLSEATIAAIKARRKKPSPPHSGG